MTYEELIRKYDAGERNCPICNKPLPEHQTWPGARYQICDSLECRGVIKHSKTGRYIGHDEHRCEAPDCNNFIPAARYDLRADFLTCCGECWIRRRTKGNRILKCGCGCGQEFLGRAERKPIDGLYFLSLKHYGAYLHNRYLTENCGAFKNLVSEYLDGFATLHYRETQTVRSSIAPLFTYLNEQGITSIENVTPKTITQYLVWGRQTGRRKVARTIPFLSTFFKWSIAEGHRQGGNPVVPLIHSRKQGWRMPRPLGENQLDLLWRLLHERGNPRLRLAAAIAEEAGLRIGEICRLRLQDVDLTRKRLFVGLPNKGNRERYAFFSKKTERFYAEWMAERDPDCGHDYLLHNIRGGHCKMGGLGKEFSRILCKTYQGRTINEEGFDSWSTHALRHTMASNLVSAGADAATVMAAGGWKTYEAMCGYARVDEEVAGRGYEEAMKRVEEQKKRVPRKKALSIAEFLEHKGKTA